MNVMGLPESARTTGAFDGMKVSIFPPRQRTKPSCKSSLQKNCRPIPRRLSVKTGSCGMRSGKKRTRLMLQITKILIRKWTRCCQAEFRLLHAKQSYGSLASRKSESFGRKWADLPAGDCLFL